MRGKIHIVLFIFLLLFVFGGTAQEKKHEFSGYLGSLHSYGYENVYEDNSYMNKLNLRLNSMYTPHEHLTIDLALHGSVYQGTWIDKLPNFKGIIQPIDDFLPLSVTLQPVKLLYLHIRADRFNVQYSHKKFDLSLGRQHINWSQTFIWNVNNLFNNNTFADLDNPEKHSVDAVRLTYSPSATSMIETAVKMHADYSITWATMARFVRNQTEYQMQAGIYDQSDIVVGGSVVRHFNRLSLRAESSFYIPMERSSYNQNILLCSASLDYVFGNNMILQAEVLYNQLRLKNLLDIPNLLFGVVRNPKLLSGSEWNFGLTYSYQLSNRSRVNMIFVHTKDNNGYHFIPTYQFRLLNNLHMDVHGQFFSMMQNRSRRELYMTMLRIQYYF